MVLIKLMRCTMARKFVIIVLTNHLKWKVEVIHFKYCDSWQRSVSTKHYPEYCSAWLNVVPDSAQLNSTLGKGNKNETCEKGGWSYLLFLEVSWAKIYEYFFKQYFLKRSSDFVLTIPLFKHNLCQLWLNLWNNF